MRFASRLLLGTFTVVAITVLVLLWGQTRGLAGGAVVVALLVALPVAWLAGRSIAAPLIDLSATARAIASGAAPRFPRSGIPEVDALVQALRTMHRELGERFDDVQRGEAESRALVDAMVEGVIATDALGRIVIANPAARRLLGYPGDSPLPDLATLFRAKAAREAVAEVLSGEMVHDREFEREGQVFYLNARPLPGSGAVVVLHDLTEIRRLETVRRDFVANVSHELKTPLTSISGYAETLADPTMDEATRLRFVKTILDNAHRMQHLVDDLLDLSRIESGRWTPRIEPVNVEHAIGEAWEVYRDRAVARKIQFAREVAPDATRLKVDPEAFRHIIGNLFDNSLRHVAAGGHITCRSVREAGGTTISVQDDGTGIPAEHLPRIFERFYRVDPARSREEGGTGLGLAIVKHMVEAHGGRVTAESEPRVRTVIRCWFPDPGE